jgi:hypothetical protein
VIQNQTSRIGTKPTFGTTVNHNLSLFHDRSSLNTQNYLGKPA